MLAPKKRPASFAVSVITSDAIELIVDVRGF
jgi:hypothetical protein